jgi:hypothetical protein
MDVEKTGRRESKVAQRCHCMAGYFGTLAGLASSGPSAAVLMDGRPHEALGDELSRCLDAGMTQVVQGIKYLTAERRRDVGSWFAGRQVTIK